jgi:SAM-dependent methyltransferase/pyruvate-formate lyase-activating enzyme
VCPVCLTPVEARIVQKSDGLHMAKDCPRHGHFETLIWRDQLDYLQWIGDAPPLREGEGERCPADCGLCDEHKRGTCCTILELTSRCNLRCSYCFAGAGGGEDRPLAEIKRDLKALAVPGKTLVQLSGGEPTVRDDLPEIVSCARDCGCKYIQLNSNGLRLADEPEYVAALSAAGLSFVFLQFDGLTDDIYRRIRGRALWKKKLKAILNCAVQNLGVVLVVTVVPGVNDKELGEILRFGFAMSPAVRGVHFQPVTYLGRSPHVPDDQSRMTLDSLIRAIEEQTEGLVSAENLAPSCCDHPLCGFHGDFIVLPDGPQALTRRTDSPCREATADQNREFVGRRWQRPAEACCCGHDISSMDGFLENIRHYGFTVTSMAFQDADNLDFERMRFCSSHVYRDGRFIPLCAAYLTPCRTEAVSLHPGGLTLTERALSLAGLPRGAHVADVGSGTGKSLSLLRESFGLDAAGVEPDEEKRRISSEKLLAGTAEDLPFETGGLDAVLSECVLSLADPAAAMAEAARVLRPGGILMVSDLYSRDENSRDLSVLTKEALLRRAEKSGFRVRTFEDHSAQLQEMAAQMIWDEGGDAAAACAGRSLEELRRLKCGYYLMVAEKI